MIYYASRRGKAQSGEHRSGELSGLKKKIEKSSKTFEKPLDKRKEMCYNTKVTDNNSNEHNSDESDGLEKKVEKT